MATVEELKERYKERKEGAAEAPAKSAKSVKSSIADDARIEIAMKLLTLFAILIIGGVLYLWWERSVSARLIAPWRIWLSVIAWIFLAFNQKPFLMFGWWGLLATLTVIPTVSGYLWQFFQSLVGVR
jgi:hypothetical protein